jgi:hypothetical protein
VRHLKEYLGAKLQSVHEVNLKKKRLMSGPLFSKREVLVLAVVLILILISAWYWDDIVQFVSSGLPPLYAK